MKMYRPRSFKKYSSTSIIWIHGGVVVFTLPDSNSWNIEEQIRIRKSTSKYVQNRTAELCDIY